MPAVRLCAFLLLALLSPLAQAANPFTGQFLFVDKIVGGFIYVSIVQSAASVSGTMQVTTDGGAGKARAYTRGIEGVVDQNNATLRFVDGGGNISGRREHGQLVLVFPVADGGVSPVALSPTTESEVAQRISDWKAHIAQVYAEQKQLQGIAAHLDHFRSEAKATGIPDDLSEMFKDLAVESRFLEDLRPRRAHFDDLAAEATSCSQFYATVYDYYYDQIFHAYYPTFSTADVRFVDAAASLEKRIAHGESFLRDADANLARFSAALASRRYTLPKLAITPEAAGLAIANYRALVVSTPAQLVEMRARHDKVANETNSLAGAAAEVVKAKAQRCK